ncbi:amino acid transporter [Lepidopterella palustris CBS 459.81]|uniref:Amino acid transporter n=1 Tax=Lepidopterella palustris CBS 459.81 TaxID=1314670 RepID=A0A8E2E3J9_9PEZI|nr:amino acid transporter [Lepidopterella palustris CBS 459.81]
MDDSMEVVEGEGLSEADRRLAEMGYVQVYKREFSWLSSISFAVSISGLFASVATTFVYPLEAGGAASAVWCWLISGAGCMFIALSVSELVSAYPTSGGLYFTCKYLAPENCMAEVSWLCGWFNILGQTAGLASTEYGCAQLLLAAVSMNTNFTYVPTTRQTVGVMAAVTIFHGILNSMNTKFLERITRAYVIFHLGVLVSCCITLLVMCDYKHDSSYVWTNVAPDAGWSPPGWSFLFGFLSASWTMTDYDATAHIAEEMKNPELTAPWSITIALAFTYIGGWLFTIVLTYCTANIPMLLENPLEQPVAQIFNNVIGRVGGVTFTVFAFIILNFTGMTGMQAGARTFWALARDELMPLSRVWYKIDKRTQTPIYAVWLITSCAVAINLIGLGSYTAIVAIFNMTAIALDWSYCIPIICKMITNNFKPGPFHMGKASFWVNAWAVLWTTFVSIIFILPTVRPVTAQNMNYAAVILVGIALFAVAWWYISGRQYYVGPRVKAAINVAGPSNSAETSLQRSIEENDA